MTRRAAGAPSPPLISGDRCAIQIAPITGPVSHA
jgi:hypothetical protein